MRKTYDVVIIGAGIMGLMTARLLALQGQSVIILEKHHIGHMKAASSGLTRSIRCDYSDPFYAHLALQAQDLWRQFESDTGCNVYENCGLVNLASPTITSDLKQSYAVASQPILKLLGKSNPGWRLPDVFRTETFSFDKTGGILKFKIIRETLARQIASMPTVELAENVAIQKIDTDGKTVNVSPANGESWVAEKCVIAAGLWGADILRLIPAYAQLDYGLQIRSPKEVRYFDITPKRRNTYTTEMLPVFACLDMGVYGHPIVQGYTQYLKISHYWPPTGGKGTGTESQIDLFVKTFMPELAAMRSFPVTDADQCSYDYSQDGDFILGYPGEEKNILIATGWNGTAGKFAPVIAAFLADLTMNKAVNKEMAKRFDPQRFTGFGET